MDFAAPPPVIRALEKRVRHGVFGYPLPTDSYVEAFADWEESALGYAVEREWVVHCSAVMPAMKAAITCFSDPGDGVIVQPPVYRPFFKSVTDNGRRVVRNPLRLDDTTYSFDVEQLRRVAAEEKPSLLLLCSPHNPVGRVWTTDELRAVAEVCAEHEIIVIADEIHCGLTFEGHRFVPFTEVSQEAAGLCVACHSPSKTFNIAGLPTSQIIIPNGSLRRRFKERIGAMGHYSSGVLDLLAAETAYREGEEWRRALISYLDGNRRWLKGFLDTELPRIRMIPLEGTYIPWLDFRGLPAEVDGKEMANVLRDQAGVWLHDGPWFGNEGQGFQRINIACPRTTLERAMTRIEGVLKEYAS
jgi:cystathionine beta-lyase